MRTPWGFALIRACNWSSVLPLRAYSSRQDAIPAVSSRTWGQEARDLTVTEPDRSRTDLALPDLGLDDWLESKTGRVSDL